MTPRYFSVSAVVLCAIGFVMSQLPPALAIEPVSKRQFRMGSGFYVNETGVIVTNLHVIDGCQAIYVRSGKLIYEAVKVASHKPHDLAAIETAEEDTAYGRFSTQDVVQGDAVFSYGFSLARGGLLATGRVRSLAGPLNEDWAFTHDAVVSAGNSGGPIADRTGALIGSNYRNLHDTFNKQTLSFSIKASSIIALLKANKIKFYTATEPSAAKEHQEHETGLASISALVICKLF